MVFTLEKFLKPYFYTNPYPGLKKTLALFAHPYFEFSYANAELIKAYEISGEIEFRDIYEEYSDFHIAAFRERKRIKNYERVIIHFPMIWFGMPPLLKLWIDEVFDMKWQLEDEENPVEGKEAFIVVTCGGREEHYCEEGVYKAPVNIYLKGLIQSLEVNGFNISHIVTVYDAENLLLPDLEKYRTRLEILLNE